MAFALCGSVAINPYVGNIANITVARVRIARVFLKLFIFSFLLRYFINYYIALSFVENYSMLCGLHASIVCLDIGSRFRLFGYYPEPISQIIAIIPCGPTGVEGFLIPFSLSSVVKPDG